MRVADPAARMVAWSGAAVSAWVLAGYPLLLLLRDAVPPTRRRAGEGGTRTTQPDRVTIIVPAFGQPEAFAAKLEALRALEHPPDHLQVIAALDQDPALVDAARRAYPGVTVTFAAHRRGKAGALADALELAAGDIVLLTDADNLIDRGALRAALPHFRDPLVWGVVGRRAERGSAYDRYEDLIRRLESRSGSVAAASGEMFLIRRERMPSLPRDVVNEDLWLLCRLVGGGGRVVYEPAAVSLDLPVRTRAELQRRTRIAAGRMALARNLLELPPGFALRLLSHKYGRLALPFSLAATWVPAVGLSRRTPGFRAPAAAGAALVILGAAGASGHAPDGKAGLPVRVAGQFLVGNIATAAGVLRALRGGQDVCWEPVH